MPPVFRFAPSPNGYLHLGHAFSALLNFDLARASGGRLLLRIEDIDPTRCRPEYEEAIYQALAWLGISWEAPVRRQSEHLGAYRKALDRLAAQGLIYPGFESRADIAKLVRQREAQGPWPRDPDGAPLYPGEATSVRGRQGRSRRNRLALRVAARHVCVDRACRRIELDRMRRGTQRRDGPACSSATSLGRCRSGAQGDADQLSSFCRRRRRAAGRDRRRQGRRSVPRDQRAPAAAAATRSPRTGLSPPSSDLRRGRTQARQVNPIDRLARTARPGRDGRRHPQADRPSLTNSASQSKGVRDTASPAVPWCGRLGGREYHGGKIALRAP